MFKARLLLLLMLTFALPAQGASVYVYINAAGNKLITAYERFDLNGYTLFKKYGSDDGIKPSHRSSGVFGYRALNPVQSRFDNIIISKAYQFGLEPALLKAIVHVESSFNPDALSPKGAKGLMQLMPETARRYGVNTLTDPIASLEGGGQYILDLLVLFDYDIELALAAYNAGEGAVLKYNGIPPYRETENYVQSVITLRNKYRKNLVGA